MCSTFETQVKTALFEVFHAAYPALLLRMCVMLSNACQVTP